MTALHIACELGRAENVALLLTKGAAIKERDMNNMTPLAYACKNGHLEAL